MNRCLLIVILLITTLLAGCTSQNEGVRIPANTSTDGNSIIVSEKVDDESNISLAIESSEENDDSVVHSINESLEEENDESSFYPFEMMNIFLGPPKWFGEQTMKDVLGAVEAQNAEELKGLFSSAVQTGSDLDESISKLYAFVNGEIVSYQRVGGSESTSVSDGIGYRECYNGYEVITDKEEYLFLILECLEDEQNPDNIGIYTLCVMKKEDQNRESIKPQDVKAPGIFIREYD